MGRLPVLLILALAFFAQPVLFAQNESAVRAIIGEGDIKKLSKADAYKTEADKLIEEASRLNMEVFTVQSDPSAGEKAIAKKVKQLEEQALQKQTEAASLYAKSNEIRFTVYKQYIDEFWKTHENQESDFLNAKLLEEQSSDNYFQAVSYRLEAKKMDDLARIQKYSEAAELENQAISKQLTALSQYHGIPIETAQNTEAPEAVPTTETSAVVVAPTDNAPVVPSGDQIIEDTFKQESAKISDLLPTDSVLPKGVVLNQSMIDTYNRYIATGELNDTTLSTGAFAGETSFEHDRVLELWYEYIYGRGEIQGDVTEADTLVQPDERVQVIDKTGEPKDEKEIGIVTDDNVDKLVPADDEVIYRVQIAANKNELTQRALSRMYYGNKNVEMINENGWYKYSVGDFESYKEASEFRKKSGISNAFVVAYRKGTRFTPPDAESNITEASEQPGSGVAAPAGTGKLPAGLIFRIQVAASRIPLTAGQLKTIYSGSYPVEMIFEDGWYKYQLMGVRLYTDAKAIIGEVNSPGAFIVAYDDGSKTDLVQAIQKNRELRDKVSALGRKGIVNDAEYHVQIAAVRTALKKDEVARLWPGSDLTVIYEEGWYKYHLKAGDSNETAKQILKSCNIKGAFIVAYKRAAKINYYDALHKN